MSLSNNIARYQDVAAILRQAHEAGGARFRLGKPNLAVRWRQRAYQYRKLLEAQYRESAGYEVPTPYDNMVLRLDGTDVIIEFEEMKGTLLDEHGNEITIEDAPEVDDDTLAAAEDFAKSLMEGDHS